MFVKVQKYQTAVRLMAKAWMLAMETGSSAALRSYQRMVGVIDKMQVPGKSTRWVDIPSEVPSESLRNQKIPFAYVPFK